MRKRHSVNALLALLTELLFILLPIMVLGLVITLHEKKSLAALAGSPEWSFAAAILFGQSIVKFVSGITRLKAVVWQSLALAVAAIIVFGLVPSLLVLSLVLITPNPTTGLLVAQLTLFVIGVLGYLLIGGIGHYGLSVEEDRVRDEGPGTDIGRH